ncbi:MAG: hypothetical protein M1824_002016 [Vezdaea acicularis]|nr:MAG: hypothetical protein M1824_002016 [Vezdaea acicularis]
MAETPDKQVFMEGTEEDVVLEKLGYQPELKRSFGLLGMIGFSFSIVTRQAWRLLTCGSESDGN